MKPIDYNLIAAYKKIAINTNLRSGYQELLRCLRLTYNCLKNRQFDDDVKTLERELRQMALDIQKYLAVR